ncbi:MAG TPA: MarR family transcriptional regulator [Syntrophomonas sp.]|nr:MarR family transcriptional regulator [Syntrophomonas sp.]
MKEIRQQLRDFNTIIKETDAIYGELAKQSGLSDCAFWLMYSLCEADGECTQKDLCDQWIISKQTVNSALKGLEKNGYITLTSSETDKRSKYIVLTDKGVRFAHEHIDIVFKLEELAFEKLSVTERAAMLEANRKYQELLQAEAERFLNK